MKTKRTILSAFLLISVMIGFNSCLEGGDNKQSWGYTPAVVTYDFKIGTAMDLGTGGVVAAPTLSNFMPGDNILAAFTINYDNQPSTQYNTATEIQVYNNDALNVATPVEIASDDDMWDLFTDTVYAVGPASLYSFNVNSRLFLAIGQRALAKQEYAYEMICNTDSVSEKGIQSVYLKAMRVGTPSGSTIQDLVLPHVFDMSAMTDQFGKDTTINNTNYISLKFNLKYQSGINSNTKKTVFTEYAGNPIHLLIKE